MRSLFLALLATLISGCATLEHLATDTTEFQPMQSHNRVSNKSEISVFFVNDINIVCKKKVGAILTKNQEYMACAQWFADAGVCHIFLPHRYSIVYLGHEFRHCFEGHFH